jgi:transglutaminase-like putative cysteine protease
VSEVTCYFLRSPNYKKIGTSDVTIVLEDSYGNKSQYDAKLTVKHDNDPPVFSGVRDIIIYQGQTIPYRKNVIAEDAKDGPVKFDVDSSAVRPNKPGTYEVVYSAVDKAGNKAIKKATVTVKKFEPTKEAVYAMADDILERIIKPKMSKREIAYEIYKYVLNNVAYTGSSEKGDVIKEAYRAMKYRAGDCFTYYSLSEVLLTRAGIDNMMVTRVGGKTEHYWNLINCGDGWYHFDATPHAVPVETFMMTDERTEELTKRFGRNYYVFDRSKYPATPKE